jgi:ribonuclease HI
MLDPYALKVYIDGSAFRNPGHEGGLAGVAEFPERLNRGPEIIFTEGYKKTTNNRMELRAFIQALEYVCDNANALDISRAIILSDSEYIVDNHKFASLWRKNSWRNRHGRPVENKDLWKRFLSVRSRVRARLDVEWNRGKSTPVLRMVDRLAKSAAKETLTTDQDLGYRPGKVSRHGTTERGAATLFPANNQELIIRVYAHTVAGKDDCKVSFTIYSETERTFTKKHIAYTARSDRGEIHRHRCYKVRFNDNPNFPVFAITQILGCCPGAT